MRAVGQTPCRYPRSLRGMLAAVALVQPLMLSGALRAEEDDKVAIEALLQGGWQVAGYTSTLDGRSAFILFRHPSEPYLVQCRAGYDVTRTPREFSNCYKLR